MKSILQNIALLSSILLIASCDSGGGGGVADIGVSLPTPTNGATGSAVKGVISGGNITVTDASGADISLASGTTTNADGSYRLIFTQAEIDAGITAPLIVTISGGNGATMVCDIDNANTTDDCPVGDGTFAAFGTSYTLPADFQLSGIISEIPADNPNADPVVNINVNPATDLAAAFAKAAAGTSALTATDVTTATTAVLGLIQQITGVNLAGQDLNAITIPNIADNTAGASDLGLALASFAAAIIADQGANESVSAAIARIKASVSVDANGNITGTGTNLGRIASAVAKALAVVNEKSGGTNAAIANAISNANSNAATLTNQGDSVAVIAKPPAPGSTEPADLTKTLVGSISDVITNIVATTGAAGFGVTGAGETEVFATELEAVRLLTSADATAAFNLLDAAAKDAFASGGATDTDATDGVTGTLAVEGGVVTVTDATATSGNVTITVASGTSNGDTFEITGVTMV
ncbi:MAG: hypothetical protein KDI36_11285, partial [Pseudomonadales bacterium]|nr:hypothetical protein [Pseudomonadales bacterium]